MNNTTNIRRAVATMANKLRGEGLTLSEAFKKAWRRVKATMTFRVAGVTFENRQEILKWFRGFNPADVRATLEREANNPYDSNAIKIVLHISKYRACVGYVNKELAKSLSAVIDKGIELTTTFCGVIGGYGNKDNVGCLISIGV